MTQDEIDLDWAGLIAEDIVDELIAGKVVSDADLAKARAIAEQMIHVHLISGDRPDAANRRCINRP